MKALITSAALLTVSVPAFGQWAVIDAANLQQAAVNYAALVEQLSNQATQISNQVRQIQQFETQLTEAEVRVHQALNPGLIDALPVGTVEVDQLPENLARKMFEALRLEIRYNKITNRAVFRVTLSGPTVSATRDTVSDAVRMPTQRAIAAQGHKRATAVNQTGPRRSHPCSAPGRIRTYAPASGGRCSIP